MPSENEQWLMYGDCSKCRRKNYCSKPCTVSKRNFKSEMYSIVRNAMNKAMNGALDILEEKVETYMDL